MPESSAGRDAEPTAAQPHRVFACERCSRRKQRCDRILPVCSPCRVSGSQCSTSERENGIVQIGGQEIARKGYVTTLLERIATLEQQIATSSNNEPHLPSPSDATPGGSVPTPSRHGRAASATSDSRWPLDGGSADMNMESLSLSAMAEPLSRAGEFLKQLSMPRIIAGVTETYGGNPEATARVDSLWDGISKYIRNPMGQTYRLHVQPAEACKSLETYLDIVDFRFPQLPLAKVKSGFNAITADEEGEYKETLERDPAHIFMAYMVLAIVPLISDDYPISQGSFVSIQLLGKCLKVLERVFRQEDGVDIIQCLHLLVIFSIHCSAAGSSWHLIGFAMNKCIGLGYHLEAPTAASGGLDAAELEQRRWAFWACYLLDRFICAALGRPFSIEDQHITVSLPKGSEIDHKEAFHIHLFRYAKLMSSAISHGSSEDFDHSLDRVLHWRVSTPPNVDMLSREPYLYQTSLFHTLMLRIAIHEILRQYLFEASDTGDSTTVRLRKDVLGVAHASGDLGQWDRKTVQRTKLFDVSLAVAGSLDRTRMTGRHFLSLLTGYSAFSMALATIFHQLVMKTKRQRDISHETRAPELGASRYRSQQGAKRPMCEDDVLDMALQKLDIVARQFPRMQEYKQTIQMMRSAIAAPPSQTNESSDRLEDAAMNIGPPHLRKLGLVIVSRHRAFSESITNHERNGLHATAT